MSNKLTAGEIAVRLELWRECGYSSQEASKQAGVGRRSFDRFLERYADKDAPISKGVFDQTTIKKIAKPKKGHVKRYILTCAQNNTNIHHQFFNNLEAYAIHIDAEIKVSRFTYNKNAFQKNRKQGDTDTTEETYYDPNIAGYISDDIERLAPSLIWCGNLQLSPTAVDPMSGLNDYTGPDSSIMPHTRVSMNPVPTPRRFRTKHMYTTGCCTLKNYIMAKAGQKAEFHHTFGALIVEVLADGSWFVRQLVGDNEGTFHDLDVEVKEGAVCESDCVEAIQWGDIHLEHIDKDIQSMFWQSGDSVIDLLKPKVQLFHDLIDGHSHNPHEAKNPLRQYQNHIAGKNCVRTEFEDAQWFLDKYAYRAWCKSYVIWSNHDEFMRRWLHDSNYKSDHVNSKFILKNELTAREQADRGESVSYFRNALDSQKSTVLTSDEGNLSVKGVLLDFHGNNGAGGSRGSVKGFSKSGHKTMTGHSHSAWWIAGATSAGTCSNLYLGYNNGLSSWSHTFTVLYKSGKRCQVTANSETKKWRA